MLSHLNLFEIVNLILKQRNLFLHGKSKGKALIMLKNYEVGLKHTPGWSNHYLGLENERTNAAVKFFPSRKFN